MRRLVHISDLHFGRDRPELLAPLTEAINEIAPDMVAISGDLTQRAKPAQFREARQFIDGLDPDVLVVPGNHDVPLHNLVLRLINPWSRYRRWISPDLEPSFEDDEVLVIGVNTVNPLSHQRGWFTKDAVARVCDAFRDTRGRRTRLVVAHHPMEHLPGQKKRLMRGARRAIEQLSACKADVILSGHLHTWRVEPFAMKEGRNMALQVHAGTGLSTRLRGEVNDFNLLEIESAHISVTRHAYQDESGRFKPTERRQFTRDGAGWNTWSDVENAPPASD